jgi:PHD/YefM family antitoxin component YafN of YafNO toxin-antitoxin module
MSERHARRTARRTSASDLEESLEATIELLFDPDAQARIAQSERELTAGQLATIDELRDLMETRRRSRRSHS